MGSETRQTEILRRVLEISKLQAGFIEENMLEEVLRCQVERDGLFDELKSLNSDVKDDSVKEIINEIIERDNAMSEALQGRMCGIKHKLRQIKDNGKAIKAYSAK